MEPQPSGLASDGKKGWLRKTPGVLALLTWLGMAAMWFVVGGLFLYLMLFLVF